MGKLSTTRLMDTAKLLATKSGQELAELINYVNDSTADIVRVLRKNLSFTDNVNCKVADYTLTHGEEQQISTDNRQPIGIIPVRVNSTAYSMDSFGWYMNTNGSASVKASYDPVPSSGQETQTVTLIVLF